MKSGDSMKERGQYERVETVRKSGDSMDYPGYPVDPIRDPHDSLKLGHLS